MPCLGDHSETGRKLGIKEGRQLTIGFDGGHHRSTTMSRIIAMQVLHRLVARASQAPTLATPITFRSSAKSFAGETPKQRLQRREAAWREKTQQEKNPRTPKGMLFPRLRKRELERIFILRWGSRTLPDDDAGRGDLRLMADHLAQLGKKYVEAWASLWAPWLSEEETDALIEEVGAGKYWTAAALAEELNLDDATRARLDIRTIRPVDCDEALRLERQKAKKVARRKAKRASARALRPPPASETKPWLALGKSKRWWYAHGKPTPPKPCTKPDPSYAYLCRRQQLCTS
jgi:hypothetical protein